MTGVTIAIPTYNRARLLRRTLEGIARMSLPSGMSAELLVIDNNCTDNTREVVAELSPRMPFPVRLISEPEPGLNHGRNRALRDASFDHVVYFDDDVDVAPDWLEGYREAVGRLQAECVVGPVMPTFEREIPSCMTRVVLESLTSPYSVKGDALKLLPDDVAHEVPGCNFGVSKAAALKVGGFRSGLDRAGSALLAGGDSEFGARMVKAGKRTAYQPRCAVAHVISQEKLDKNYLRLRWRGLGVTVRRMEQPGRALPWSRRMRQWLGVARLFAASALWTLLGRKAQAFERELQGFKALGYATGR